MYNRDYYNAKLYNQKSGFTQSIDEESLSLTESNSKLSTKIISEISLGLADAILATRIFIKVITETALSITESLKNNIGKIFSDNSAVTEAVAKLNTFLRIITETTLSISDTIGNLISKAFSDLVSSVDSIVTALVKNFTQSVGDTVSLTENFIKTLAKNLSEITLNIVENITTQLFKAFNVVINETISITENVIKAIIKEWFVIVNDTISIAEAFTKKWKSFISGVPGIISSVFNKASLGSAIRQKPENNVTIKLAKDIGSAVNTKPKY